MIEQLALDLDPTEDRTRCQHRSLETYGAPLPEGGWVTHPPVRCAERATHRAESFTDTGELLARFDGCLTHADYMARGWFGPLLLYPAIRESVAIRPLGALG